MQGVWINGQRPLSKEHVIEAINTHQRVEIENLQFFGSWYSGLVGEMPDGAFVGFVGPDPFIAREWYGTIEKRNGKVTIR